MNKRIKMVDYKDLFIRKEGSKGQSNKKDVRCKK